MCRSSGRTPCISRSCGLLARCGLSRLGQERLELKDKVFDLVLLCPFISSDDVDLYGYMAPTIVLLAFNSFFLFWIMGVSV